MKQALIAVVLVAVGSVLAHLHVVAQTYHPVTRISTPEGLVFTAVQHPTPERTKCGAANDRFLFPIKAQCAGCKVELARCERELEPFQAEILEGKAKRYHQVSAPNLRMTIEGPPELAGEGCRLIAVALVKSGHKTAACVPPQL